MFYVIFDRFSVYIVIEVLNHEYGDHTERMVMAVENGRCYRWNKPIKSYKNNIQDLKNLSGKCWTMK